MTRCVASMAARVGILLGLGAGMLAGCGAGHCIDPANVTYRLTRPDQVEAGKKATLILEIRNRSEDFMLLERVSGDQVDASANDSLVGPAFGSLERAPDGGSWLYNPIAQSETPGVFGTGLVAPQGSLRVEVDLVPVNPDGMLTIHYRGLDSQEASRWLYFAREAGREALQRFEKLNAEEIGTLAESAVKASGDAGEGTAVGPLSRVILDDRLLQDPATCTMEMPYRLNLPK